MHFYDSPKTFKNCLIESKLTPLGHEKTFGGMVGRCMPNSGHGGPSGIRVMTIFVFMSALKFLILNILKYMEVYRPREVSHLFSREISRRMPSESCLGTHFWCELWPYLSKRIFGSNSHFWKRSGVQDMNILLDLPVVGLQFFEIISKPYIWKSKSRIFEIISKIWSPNPYFLK